MRRKLAIKNVVLRKGLRIDSAVDIRKGEYVIGDRDEEGVVRIEGRDFEVDLKGVRLRGIGDDPWDFHGFGFLLKNCRNVTVRNGSVGGYRMGIRLEGCRDVTIVDCDVSGNYDQKLMSTPEKYDPRDWVDIFRPKIWQGYGYGIYLENCRNCRLISIKSSRHQNGIGLAGCSNIWVEGCDVSRNSGWGVWMWDTSDSFIVGNNANHCVRCEGKTYSAGGDAAGIMLSNNCCRNVIANNTCTHGGDGFFLSGLNVKESTDNLVAFNDGSHSPHNAFESTHSRGNVFVGNIASNSRYGLWLGCSYENKVIGNLVENNLFDGVAIDHGYQFVIAGNEVRRNRCGIALMYRKRGKTSRNYWIVENNIESNRVGVLLERTRDSVIEKNHIARNGTALEFKNKCENIRVGRNNIIGSEILGKFYDSKSIFLDDNYWDEVRVRDVLKRIEIKHPDEVRLERVIREKFDKPQRPILIDYPSEKRKKDHRFIWYAGLKHLVGL